MGSNHKFWDGRRVCVTGGTGLLGYQIVRQLLREGARVRVLALPLEVAHPLLDQPGIETVFGDVRDRAVVRRAVVGCDMVFHTAGVVAVWGPLLRQMHSVNVDGTRLVLEAAGRDTRVVHTSSVVAVGASRSTGPLDEDHAFNLGHLRVDYVHAKHASERVALDAAARGQDVVVTNPGYMVGPDDYHHSVMGRFCRRFWKGRIPVAPPGGYNLVDVRDVARGHLLAAERGQAGRRYILGGEDRTFPEFLARLAEAAGMSPRAIPRLPGWALGLLAGLGEGQSWRTGREPYPSLQHVRLNRYYWFYRSDRAVRELGFRPRPLAASLADTYRWHLARRALVVGGLNRWWLRPADALDQAA